MYYVYILKCGDGTYYIGIAQNVEKRLRAHNGLIKGGAKYTSGRRPVELLYKETFDSKGEALKREYQLKQLSHREKKEIVNESATAR